MKVGAYPGTFDPPTVAHLAIAEAAWRQGGLDRVELVVCETPLGKRDTGVAPLGTRLQLLEALAEPIPWMAVTVNTSELICEIAAGYDAVVMGSDKWAQVVDPYWYGGSEADRDTAVAALPRLLLAPRGAETPSGTPRGLPQGSLVLDLDPAHAVVSATAVREGRVEWLAPGAQGTWRPAEGAGRG